MRSTPAYDLGEAGAEAWAMLQGGQHGLCMLVGCLVWL